MENETKNEKFKRLASKRTTNILNQLRLLGNLSNKVNYEYRDEDVRRIFQAIDEELRLIRIKFQQKGRREFRL